MAGAGDILAVEQQLQAELEQITDAHTRALVAAWATAWSEVSADLLDTLAELMTDGSKVTAATVVRSVRLQQELAGIADRLDELATDAGVTITRDLADVVAQGVDGQIGLLLAQLAEDDPRVEQTTRRTPSKAMRALVGRFTERVTSQTLPLADETYDAIQRELVRGIAVGSNPRETARRMVARAEDHWNFGLNRALTLSRTETVDAYREAARVEQDQHADVLAGWLWLAHLSSRTCRSCIAMNGRLFPLDVPGPHDHQQGRCTRCPVVKELDGSDPDLSWAPDADEHFAALSKEEQVAILGQKGFREWKAGRFPREQWTKTRSADGWRDSQVPAAPGDADGGSGIPPALGIGAAGDDEPEFDFKGDHVDERERDFVERFLAAGHQIDWIARGANGTAPNGDTRATNDFVWVNQGNIEVELKSPKLRYGTILSAITDAVRSARRTGVAKSHFVLNFGDQQPPVDLLAELQRYNLDRTRYQITQLWVFWDETLQEIELLKQ